MADTNTDSQVDELEELSVPLIYDELRFSVDSQRQTLSTIESKAATSLGFSGAVLALLFGNLQNITLSTGTRVAVSIGVTLALVATLLYSLVIWSKRIRIDPSPDHLLRKYFDKELVDTQLAVCVSRAEAFDSNQKLIERTATLFRIAMLIQIVSILSLGIAVLTLTFSIKF